MNIEKFEGLIAWQKARELTKEVYKLTRQEPFCRDLGFSNQIQRSAVSVRYNSCPEIVPIENITSLIFQIRGQRVMLDRLAPLNCSKNKPIGHSTGGPGRALSG